MFAINNNKRMERGGQRKILLRKQYMQGKEIRQKFNNGVNTKREYR